MEKMTYDYAAGAPASGRALAGVVGSGDLEVLLEPGTDGITTVTICTSVDGMTALWKALLDRLLTVELLPAVRLEINDFGATPGVVRLRIAQAFDELKQCPQPSLTQADQGQP